MVKKTEIDSIIEDVLKKFGDESLVDMSLIEADHPSISTGFANIDAILGVGGLPKGRLIELFGPEQAGKSTLSIHAAVEAQKEDGLVVYIDFEHSFDPKYAKALGLDVDDRSKFIVAQPPHLQEGMNIAAHFIRAGLATMVIVDSIAAGAPQQEVEGDDVGSNRIGLHSLVWANILKQITHDVHASDCVLIGVNQVRTKIGVTFGSSEDTPGGRAWKHYASQRIKLVKVKGREGRYTNELGLSQEGQVGMEVRVEVAKNKLAAPFRSTTLYMNHGKGFDIIQPAIDEGLLKIVLRKNRQGWIEWGKEGDDDFVKIRGDEKFREYLREDTEEFNRLLLANGEASVPTAGTTDF